MEKYKKLFNRAQQESLTDDEYLEKYMSYIHTFKANEIYGIKDTSSTHLLSTTGFAKMVGLKNSKDSFGKKDKEMPCKTAEFADVFNIQDREVEKTRSEKIILDIHEFSTGFGMVQTIKSPIINPTTQNVLGTIFRASNFTISSQLKIIMELHGKKFSHTSSMTISNAYKKLNLSNLEQEVLFCICLGFGSKKSIANFLSFIHEKEISSETTVRYPYN